MIMTNQKQTKECDCGNNEFNRFDVCTNCGARKEEGCFDTEQLDKDMGNQNRNKTKKRKGGRE